MPLPRLEPTGGGCCFRGVAPDEEGTSTAVVHHDEDLEVREVADRDGEAPRMDRSRLLGCGFNAKNVCRRHALSCEEVQALDDVTRRLYQYVDSLGKECAQSCNNLILLTYTNAGGFQRYLWRLLVDAWFNPKVQIYSPLVVYGQAASSRVPLEFPLDAEIKSGKPRMETLDTDKECVAYQTSDEFGWEAAREHPDWSLHPVRFAWDDTDPSLLRLTILGIEAAYVHKAATRVTCTHVDDDLGVLFREDPTIVTGLGVPAPPPAAPPADNNPWASMPSESDSVLDGIEEDPIAQSDLEDWPSGGGTDFAATTTDEGEHGPDILEKVPVVAEPDVDVAALEKVLPGGGGGRPGSSGGADTGCGGRHAARHVGADPHVGVAAEAPAPDPAAADMGPRAAPNENQEWVDGWLLTRLRTKGKFVGFSIRCPKCGIVKDLSFVPSGMPLDEALRRLKYWATHCCENHRGFGGRLLKDCQVIGT
jgi:hypothetical protein